PLPQGVVCGVCLPKPSCPPTSPAWNMARVLKIMENEKHPLEDLKNDENTEIREKREMHTVGPGI
ncbi:hypothetical protein ACKUFN_26530, partial [Escherichia coli]|uniref:hypothetical protein n=1 Tax=Escherichia coli TaxID=562 RepID=UPI00390CCA08